MESKRYTKMLEAANATTALDIPQAFAHGYVKAIEDESTEIQFLKNQLDGIKSAAGAFLGYIADYNAIPEDSLVGNIARDKLIYAVKQLGRKQFLPQYCKTVLYFCQAQRNVSQDKSHGRRRIKKGGPLALPFIWHDFQA